MSKLTEVNLVENIIKKKLLLELLPIMNVNERSHQEQRSNEYNGYREMTSVTHVTNQLCQQTALKFLPPLLQHAFHSFIHLFALSLISPSTVKGFFFVFRSISNTVNVNKPLSIFCILHGISAPDQQFGKRKMMLMEK